MNPVAAYLILNEEQQQRRPRRWWVRPGRDRERSEFKNLPQLRTDPEAFFRYTRMSISSFDELLSLLLPEIEKQDNNYRSSISAEERLIVTLRCLATGCTFRALSVSFGMADNTIGGIVHSVCSAIWNILQPMCLPIPAQETWINNAAAFTRLWNYPMCVGAVDGKHVRIRKPGRAGSMYYNYKDYNSIVLQAVVDANKMFTIIDVGDYGKNSDGSVLRFSSFGRALQRGTLSLPPAGIIEGIERPIPHHFISDEAYPLSENLMRPYPLRSLTNRTRVFNARLSRARKTVECAFGILSLKWEIFLRPLVCDVERAKLIVRAACVLHNFIRSRDGAGYDGGTLDSGDEFLNENGAFVPLPHPTHIGRAGEQAKEIRDALADYFMSDNGRLNWLNEIAMANV